MGDVAARAAFGCSYGEPAPAQGVEQDFLSRKVGLGYKKVAEYGFQLVGARISGGFHRILISSGHVEAQADVARVGKVGQMRARGEGVLECGELFSQIALGYSADYERAMLYPAVASEVLEQPRKHLHNEGVARFKRYAGHRYEHFPSALEPHHRSGAEGVANRYTRSRHHRLTLRQAVHVKSATREDALYVFHHFCVEAQFAAKHLYERGFGNIILCGAEAAGSEHHVGGVEGRFNGVAYGRGIVGHGGYLRHLPSSGGDRAGDVAGIGVGHLAEQQFVADDYYAYFHMNAK